MSAPAWVTSELAMVRLPVALAIAILVLSVAPGAHSQTSDLVDRSALRVCADPANMPFSNDRGEGFENRLAELFAKKLGVSVEYTWFPQATGFIRRTLRARKCDVVMGYVQGHPLVQNTNHYYRSAYVLVTPAGGPLAGVAALNDPRLEGKAIGIIAGTPPATIMALNGLMGNARSFRLTVDRRYESPAQDMIGEIASGALDGGILWGPIGGYYARESAVPLTVKPLVMETRGPRMVYRITLGIRPLEPDWKHRLNTLIADNEDDILAILRDYGVPLLDEDNRLIGRE